MCPEMGGQQGDGVIASGGWPRHRLAPTFATAGEDVHDEILGHRPSTSTVVAVGATSLALGGIAFAAIPDSHGRGSASTTGPAGLEQQAHG